jgi:hypothetical protein
MASRRHKFRVNLAWRVSNFPNESIRFSHSMCYSYSCFGRSSLAFAQFQVKSLTAQMGRILPCKKPAGIIITFRLNNQYYQLQFLGILIQIFKENTYSTRRSQPSQVEPESYPSKIPQSSSTTSNSDSIQGKQSPTGRDLPRSGYIMK